MIDKLIGGIISMANLNQFTVVEIRAAYIAIKQDQTLNPSDVRRYVYKELVKLISNGWLVKNKSEKRGITRYSKTELFDSRYFDQDAKKILIAHSVKTNVHKQILLKRLHDYHNQLLEGVGAINELENLISNYPDLTNSTQEIYDKTRDNNTQLIGRIKTLEFIINLRKKEIKNET